MEHCHIQSQKSSSHFSLSLRTQTGKYYKEHLSKNHKPTLPSGAWFSDYAGKELLCSLIGAKEQCCEELLSWTPVMTLYQKMLVLKRERVDKQDWILQHEFSYANLMCLYLLSFNHLFCFLLMRRNDKELCSAFCPASEI